MRGDAQKGLAWTRFEIVNGSIIKINKSDLEHIKDCKWRVSYRRTGEPVFQTFIADGRGKYRTVSLAKYLLNPAEGLFACLKNPTSALDFRRSNLMICDGKARRRHNRKSLKGYTSLYKGVSYNKQTQKWRASIMIDRKQYYIGEYDNELDAADAYNKAVIGAWGDNAYVNPIESEKI